MYIIGAIGGVCGLVLIVLGVVWVIIIYRRRQSYTFDSDIELELNPSDLNAYSIHNEDVDVLNDSPFAFQDATGIRPIERLI